MRAQMCTGRDVTIPRRVHPRGFEPVFPAHLHCGGHEQVLTGAHDAVEVAGPSVSPPPEEHPGSAREIQLRSSAGAVQLAVEFLEQIGDVLRVQRSTADHPRSSGPDRGCRC